MKEKGKTKRSKNVDSAANDQRRRLKKLRNDIFIFVFYVSYITLNSTYHLFYLFFLIATFTPICSIRKIFNSAL